MQKTLMEGLNEKDMQAVIRTYDLKPYYYPTLFPLKETNLLTWKMLEAQAGLKIAADIVAAYYYQAGTIENGLKYDNQMKEAVRLLLNPAEYKKILNGK